MQTLACPKCQGSMRTHNRNGIHIEQCDNCRGIFLDYGELEAITQLQNQWMQQQTPPMPQQPMMQPSPMTHQQPAWGAPPGYHKKHKKGFMGMLFSS
jgi:Zn-finger nucleic acid-binding protein